MSNQYQKGVSVLFAILILSVMLSMVLGLTTIVATQIRNVKGMGDSIVAFYAADAGIEYMLDLIIRQNSDPGSSYTAILNSPQNTILYDIEVFCCQPGLGLCINVCPVGGPPVNTECGAPRYCVRSVGIYKSSAGEAKRAIEVQL